MPMHEDAALVAEPELAALEAHELLRGEAADDDVSPEVAVGPPRRLLRSACVAEAERRMDASTNV